eukprot:TRINITY_DN25377_c0_g1_i1.p1 TRINITY_DN25377_c0_g1~~TRINITY_DN25377_c0_g1_i1.p1  ORF type:complete len:422 (+),score=60.56 TRINITY_DN25377_c0_g1_i1:121-1386(+)
MLAQLAQGGVLYPRLADSLSRRSRLESRSIGCDRCGHSRQLLPLAFATLSSGFAVAGWCRKPRQQNLVQRRRNCGTFGRGYVAQYRGCLGAVSRRCQAERRQSEDLIAWLRECGAEGLDGIRLEPVPGRGLAAVADKNFEPGDLVCHVPGSAIIAPAPQKDSEESGEVALAIELLKEERLEVDSCFAPYIASLPRGADLAPCHPLFWPDDLQIDDLLGGSAHGRRLAREAIEDGRLRVADLLRSGYARSEEEAKWALAIVDSRAFTFLPDSDEEQLALIPLLDMLNTFTLLAEDDGASLWQCAFESEKTASDGADMMAEQPIAAGEELLHLYSTNSSAMLWMVYGFLEDGSGANPCEMAGVDVDIALELDRAPSPLREAKATALSALDVDCTKPLLFELPDDAQTGGLLMPVARVCTALHG